MSAKKDGLDERERQGRYVEWNRVVLWGIFLAAAAFALGFLTGSRWGMERGKLQSSQTAAHVMPPKIDFIPPSNDAVSKEEEEEIWDYYRSGATQLERPSTEVPHKAPKVDAHGGKKPPEEVGNAIPTGGFSVQVGSFRQRERADRLARSLSSKGYLHVRVLSVEIPSRGIWYRVRVGFYKDRKDAQALAARLRSREGLDCRVIGQRR